MFYFCFDPAGHDSVLLTRSAPQASMVYSSDSTFLARLCLSLDSSSLWVPLPVPRSWLSPIFFVWITAMASYPLMVQQHPPPRHSPVQNLKSRIPLFAYKKWQFLGPAPSFQPHFNPSGLSCSIHTSKSLQESGSLPTQDPSPLSLHPLVLSLKLAPHGQLPTLSRMSYSLLLH